MGKVHRVISVGDLVTDLIVQVNHLPINAGDHQIIKEISVEPGGAGNFLIAGARLGMSMFALGVLGDDLFGRLTLEILQKEGVDTAAVITSPESSTTTVAVLVGPNGKHVFLGKYGVGPTISYQITWTPLIELADAIFVFGYNFKDERFSATCLRVMEAARNLDVPVFFDPGPFMAQVDAQLCHNVVSLSRVVMLTEDEVPVLTGGMLGIDGARDLLTRGPNLVCIKRGDNGCILVNSSQEISHPGFIMPLVDTSAAGDAFAAAFIYGYLQQWRPEEIIIFANAMGAAKVQKVGSGTQVPNATEVQAVLDQFQIRLQYRSER